MFVNTDIDADTVVDVGNNGMYTSNTWYGLFRPYWTVLCHVAPVSDIKLFSNHVTSTGFTPDDMHHWSVAEIATRAHLPIPDAAVIRLALTYESKRMRRGEAPFAQHESVLLAGERADNVSDFDFAERALTSRDPYGNVDFTETMLCTSGPHATLSVEESLHSLLTIPETLLLGFTVVNLQGALSFDGKDDAWDNPVRFTLLCLHMMSFLLHLFCLVYSMLQISLCAYAKITDRSSALYLSYRVPVRFFDICLLFFLVIIYEPLAMILYSYGVETWSGSNVFFYLFTSCGAVYVVATFAIMFYFTMRHHASYQPVSSKIRHKGPVRVHTDVPQVNTDRIWGSENAANRTWYDSLSRGLGSLRRHVMNAVFGSMSREDIECEYRNMSHIGRWRKYEMIKRVKKSAFTYLAGEQVWSHPESTANDREPEATSRLPSMTPTNSSPQGTLRSGTPFMMSPASHRLSPAGGHPPPFFEAVSTRTALSAPPSSESINVNLLTPPATPRRTPGTPRGAAGTLWGAPVPPSCHAFGIPRGLSGVPQHQVSGEVPRAPSGVPQRQTSADEFGYDVTGYEVESGFPRMASSFKKHVPSSVSIR